MEPFERLQDTRPPRYAIESDEDEDEPNPLHAHVVRHEPPNVVCKVAVSIQGKPMIYARGTAGKIWARGAQLGEQVGAVYVNDKQAAMVFLPASTESVVLVGEVTSPLPSWAQQPFVNALIGFFKPTNLLILDSYASATYVSNERISLDNAPTRFIGFGKRPSSTSDLKLFAPPNVISSTTSALISTLYLRSFSQSNSTTYCYAILLPTRYPAQPAQDTEPIDVVAITLGEDGDEWATDRIASIHEMLCPQSEWKSSAKYRGGNSRRRSGGDGMYI